MIQFSFSSVLMTVLTSNLLLILVALFFRNEKTLARVGYRLTAVYCAVTLIRLLFPCELPFTKTVVLPSGISNLFALLRHLMKSFRVSACPYGKFFVSYGWVAVFSTSPCSCSSIKY